MKGNLPYPALSAGRVVQRPARCCQGPADHVATVMQILQHHKVTQHSGKALQHKVEQRHCTHGLGLIHLQPHISGTRRRQRGADVSASRHPKPYCLYMQASDCTIPCRLASTTSSIDAIFVQHISALTQGCHCSSAHSSTPGVRLCTGLPAVLPRTIEPVMPQQ